MPRTTGPRRISPSARGATHSSACVLANGQNKTLTLDARFLFCLAAPSSTHASIERVYFVIVCPTLASNRTKRMPSRTIKLYFVVVVGRIELLPSFLMTLSVNLLIHSRRKTIQIIIILIVDRWPLCCCFGWGRCAFRICNAVRCRSEWHGCASASNRNGRLWMSIFECRLWVDLSWSFSILRNEWVKPLIVLLSLDDLSNDAFHNRQLPIGDVFFHASWTGVAWRSPSLKTEHQHVRSNENNTKKWWRRKENNSHRAFVNIPR